MCHVYAVYDYKELFASKTFLILLPGRQWFWTTVTEMILQKAAIALSLLDETQILTFGQVGETP